AMRVQGVGIARNLDREFVVLRRYVREFALAGEESNVKLAEQARSTVKEIISKGLATYKNQQRLEKIQDVSKEFENYNKYFDKVVTLKREQSSLVKDVLDPAGARLRTDIRQLQATAAKNGVSDVASLAGEAVDQLMLVRLNANKLLARHEQTS